MSKLRIQNINVKAEGVQVVTGASLEVESGQVHIIMGPNGSGKSSFVNAIFGHPQYVLESGSIEIDGENITTLPADEKAKRGLFLSQQYLPEIEGVTLGNFLYQSARAIKNTEESILDFHKRVGEQIEELGIDKALLDRELNKGLSGGEKKQSEVIQLVALSPRFAFLDEIDSGVDIDSLGKVFAGIEALRKKGTGFVLITHYTNILDRMTPDKVHVMKGGEIVKSGGKALIEEIKEKGFQ